MNGVGVFKGLSISDTLKASDVLARFAGPSGRWCMLQLSLENALQNIHSPSEHFFSRLVPFRQSTSKPSNPQIPSTIHRPQ